MEKVKSGYDYIIRGACIDAVLRTGGGQKDSRKRIYIAYMHGKAPEEMADFLKMEYGSVGKGFLFGSCPVSVWFDGSGLTAGIGNAAGAGGSVKLTWREIEARIRCMVESGSYMCAGEAGLIDDYEREYTASLAVSFFGGTVGYPEIYMREFVSLPKFHDAVRKMSQEGKAAGDIEKYIDNVLEKCSVFFSTDHCRGILACIQEMLSDSMETALLERLIEYALEEPLPHRMSLERKEYAAETLERLQAGLAEIKTPKKKFHAQDFVEVKEEDFITQDELDYRLRVGEGAKHGKFGIYDFFSEKHGVQEGSAFLDDEFGMDDVPPVLMGAAHACWCIRDGACTLEKKGEGYVKEPLTWKTVALSAEKLVKEGRYLSGEDEEGYRRYSRNRAAYAVRMECRDAIEQACDAESRRCATEKPRGIAGRIIRKYGLGNVEYVLACTIMRRTYEFSEKNVEWASGIVSALDYDSAKLEADVRPAYIQNFLGRVRRHRTHEQKKMQAGAAGCGMEKNLAERTEDAPEPEYAQRFAAENLNGDGSDTENSARNAAGGKHGHDGQKAAECGYYFGGRIVMAEKRMEMEKENQAGKEAGSKAASVYEASVYRFSAVYAKEHGELAEYRASLQINIACRYAVEKAVNENFDGMRLRDGAADSVIAEYGAERVAYVLAASVLQKEYDGRFSRENKEWAHTVPIFKDKAFDRQEYLQFAVESHPAVLDGFIQSARKAFQTLGKTVGKIASGRKSVLKTLRERQAEQKEAETVGKTAQKAQGRRKGEQEL